MSATRTITTTAPTAFWAFTGETVARRLGGNTIRFRETEELTLPAGTEVVVEAEKNGGFMLDVFVPSLDRRGGIEAEGLTR